MPGLNYLLGGKPVEGVVDLRRVEVLDVIGQEVLDLYPRRVERSMPGPVVPARGADPDLGRDEAAWLQSRTSCYGFRLRHFP